MHLHTSQGAPKTHTHTKTPPVPTCHHMSDVYVYKSSSFIQNLTKYNDISVKCRTPSLSKERCTSWPSIQATPLVSSTCGESRWRSPLPKGGLVRGHDKPIHGEFLHLLSMWYNIPYVKIHHPSVCVNSSPDPHQLHLCELFPCTQGSARSSFCLQRKGQQLFQRLQVKSIPPKYWYHL